MDTEQHVELLTSAENAMWEFRTWSAKDKVFRDIYQQRLAEFDAKFPGQEKAFHPYLIDFPERKEAEEEGIKIRELVNKMTPHEYWAFILKLLDDNQKSLSSYAHNLLKDQEAQYRGIGSDESKLEGWAKTAKKNMLLLFFQAHELDER